MQDNPNIEGNCQVERTAIAHYIEKLDIFYIMQTQVDMKQSVGFVS